MVQITTSVALFCLLVAPSLAVPLSNDQYARAEDLEERDPFGFGSAFRVVRKLATPPIISQAASLIPRDDESQLTERDIEYLNSLAARDDDYQLTERDREYLQDLAARDPWFGSSIVRAVKNYAAKIVTPANVIKAASYVISQRDLEHIEDLSPREPGIKKLFRKSRAKKAAAKSNSEEVEESASLPRREDDDVDVFERDYEFDEMD